MENKLTVARKILVALDKHANHDTYDVNDDDSDYENSDDIIIASKVQSLKNYPILRCSYPTHRIYLLRDNPWKSFFLYAAGYYYKKNDDSNDDNKYHNYNTQNCSSPSSL